MIFPLFLSLFFFSGYCAAANRPTSKPYLSGDTFRAIADHILYDWKTDLDPRNPKTAVVDGGTFDPATIKAGDIIFLRTDFTQVFFERIHPHIASPYILITHNSDHSPIFVTTSQDRGNGFNASPYLDDQKLIAWFGQNCDLACEHPKFIPIPIGLSNRHWEHSREHAAWLARFKTFPAKERTTLLYVNVNVTTNTKVRIPALNYFKTLSFCTVIPSWKSYQQFLEDLSQSKFVLSPHGNGLDCHRTWEALYMGCIPLVKTSTLDRLYKDLPVLIVEKWEDVTPEFLNQQYEKLKQGSYNYTKLFFDYWEQLIREYQEPHRV